LYNRNSPFRNIANSVKGFAREFFIFAREFFIFAKVMWKIAIKLGTQTRNA
jgi:hypothetical protein